MKFIPFALAGLLVATGALAQTPPSPPGVAAPPAPSVAPPPPPGPETDRADAPPPPPGRRGPPPPPPGADIRFDRGPGTDLHLHVHCAEADSTRTCADITEQLAAKLNVAVQVK